MVLHELVGDSDVRVLDGLDAVVHRQLAHLLVLQTDKCSEG